MIDKKIVDFIEQHHVLTLATATFSETGVAVPYCANMFYAWVAEQQKFVFTSEERTRHVSDVFANEHVAGSIVLETKTVGKIQGLQLQGTMRRYDSAQDKGARLEYVKKFPYAAVATLELWIIEPTFVKLTDNRLGFGKKIVYGVSK